MYCACDETKRIVALHDDYEVIETYIRNVEASYENSQKLHIGKIKKKKIKKLIDSDNLYLIRYADTYIQSGYLTCMELLSSQSIHDNRLCKDVLLKILECHSINDKERKSIERTVKVIDRLLQEAKEYTPSLKDLQIYESDYAQYVYKLDSM